MSGYRKLRLKDRKQVYHRCGTELVLDIIIWEREQNRTLIMVVRRLAITQPWSSLFNNTIKSNKQAHTLLHVEVYSWRSKSFKTLNRLYTDLKIPGSNIVESHAMKSWLCGLKDCSISKICISNHGSEEKPTWSSINISYCGSDLNKDQKPQSSKSLFNKIYWLRTLKVRFFLLYKPCFLLETLTINGYIRTTFNIIKVLNLQSKPITLVSFDCRIWKNAKND